MAWLRRSLSGLKALVLKERVEQDLDDELRAYLEASVEDKTRRGVGRADAVRAARVAMGSLLAVKDHTRDAGWEAGLESLWRDVRYATRTLRKSPVFSAVAVLTLGLGIGANTAIFSVINAILLRPLPVERPHELLSLAVAEAGDLEPVFSYAAYRRLSTEGAEVADALAASTARRDAIAFDGPPEPVDLKFVSGNYFSVLGVPPTVGRALLASDDLLPGEPVAVLSDAYWGRRFARDPSVVGRHFRWKATAFTVVGIAPPGFTGESPGEVPDLWIPLTAQPGAPPYVWSGHSVTWLRILARRRPGVTLDRARAGLEAVYGRMRDETAGRTEDEKRLLESRLVASEAPSGSSKLREPLSRALFVLMATVAIVLAIACANVANLMLARAAVRQREIAVCIAFGAGRLRLVRQRLVEALLLAALGGGCGMLLAAWGSSAMVALVSSALPLSLDLGPDLRVLAFTTLVSCATAIAFGLGPALRILRVDPMPELQRSGRPGHGTTRIPLRRALVVTQIALSLVLLVGAGLFVRSLQKLRDVDTGFDPDRVVLFEVTPTAEERPVSAEVKRSLYRRLLERAQSVAGVSAASLSFNPILTRETWGNAISVEGYVPRLDEKPRTLANAISPRYFEVLRIAVLSGRGFTEDDHQKASKVAVVNQAFARQFFGESNPIGRRVAFSPANEMMEVVGVSADAKYVDLREPKRPMLYVPFTQYDQSLHELEVRTALDPAAVAATLRRELAAVDQRLAIVRTMELSERVDVSLVPERLVATLSSGFGLLALALLAVGLYGVIAYATAQRTGEIGIRMALGADRRDVQRLVLRDTLALVALGLAIGTPIALGGARLVARQLYQVAPYDPLAVSLGIATLALVALVAGYLPARRASRVDPLVALRRE